MNTYLTRNNLTGLAVICAGLAVWTGAEINLGASSALRLILTTVVLLAAAIALWMLRPADGAGDRAPRPTYQRGGPSLRDRLAALTQPAPLPHRPPVRYPGHGAPPPSPLPEPVADYPEPAPAPEPGIDFDSLFNRRRGGEN